MFKHKYLKWLSIFYHQKRNLILPRWLNRHTITNQMSKGLLINHSNSDGVGVSFNEAQEAIKKQIDTKICLAKNHGVHDHISEERIENSYLSLN